MKKITLRRVARILLYGFLLPLLIMSGNLSWSIPLLPPVKINVTRLTPKQDCENIGVDYYAAVDFAKKLQQAFSSKNKIAVSKMVVYPLKINKDNPQGDIIYYYIKTPKEFIEQYNGIITPAISHATLKANPNNDIFCTDYGATIDAGGIWFDPNEHGEGIIIVNSSSKYLN